MHTLAPLIQYRVISEGLPIAASFCGVCESAIGDLTDIESMELAGCCRSCEHEFYEPNREKWLQGWRPSLKEILEKRDLRIFVSR